MTIRWTLLLLSCLLAGLGSGRAECDVLWRVGSPDNDYSEFACAGNYGKYVQKFAGGTTLKPRKDDPGSNWAYIQPGPADIWAGSRKHTQEIVFDLHSEPVGVYVLEIDLVDAHPSLPPALEVRVNGQAQTFQLRPGASDASLTDPAKGREQVIRMYLRASSLREGANVVKLTTVAGSWLLYDSLSMKTCSKPPNTVKNLAVAPTFLFRESGGELQQIVRLSMDLWESHERVAVEVTSEHGLHAEQAFERVPAGTARLEIGVPEVSAEQNARVRVRVGNEEFDAECTLTPHEHWRIYLMPSAHFDIGYTDIQDRALQIHRENIDRAIEWCERYPDFVWNSECSYIAQDYLEKGAHPQEFLQLAKQGRLGVMAFYGNELTGLCSGEELTRLLDYYDYLRKVYGIESNCAMMTDVPSMVATVPMILAGHGIKYLSHAINATRARADQAFIDTPHYWQSPDGSRLLMWKTLGYAKCSRIIGDSIETAATRINDLLSQYENRDDYPFDAILLHGGYSDNRPNREALPRVVQEWNRKYAYPKLIFCRGSEFFEYIESNFADDLKTEKGDGGVWWEDGAGSSAQQTAAVREAKEKLIAAEKLISLSGPAVQQAFADELDEAWRNVLLYDEHTWGAAQSIRAPDSKETRQQWAVKKSFADRAAYLSDQLLEDALDSAASRIKADDDSVFVFNPSNSACSDYIAHFDQTVGWLAFAAESVPPMGIKLFAMPQPPKEAEGEAGLPDVVENRFYAVRFDKATGAVSSIYDKALNRELIDSSGFGANAYLYVTGGDGSRLIRCDGALPQPDLAVLRPSEARFYVARTPVRQVVAVFYRQGPGEDRLSYMLTLRDDQKRIDFENLLSKAPVTAKEAGYFAFPFAFENPTIRIGIGGGVIRPDIDQFRGACRDWYAVDSFVSVEDGSAEVLWIPVDSPLITLQDINRGQWYQHLDINSGSVFAYAFNNYWFTNYKASQQDDLRFRFSMTSGPHFTDSQAMEFVESVKSPLVWCGAPGPTEPDNPLPVNRSLVELSRQNVIVQAVRPARFSQGVIIRLREMDGQAGDVRLTVRGIPFKRAYLCNLAEDKVTQLEITDGAVDVPCRALGLSTVLLER